MINGQVHTALDRVLRDRALARQQFGYQCLVFPRHPQESVDIVAVGLTSARQRHFFLPLGSHHPDLPLVREAQLMMKNAHEANLPAFPP